MCNEAELATDFKLSLLYVAAFVGGHGSRVPGHDAGGGMALPGSHPWTRLLNLPLREYLLSALPHRKVSDLSLPILLSS